jgi:hypothetical protein
MTEIGEFIHEVTTAYLLSKSVHFRIMNSRKLPPFPLYNRASAPNKNGAEAHLFSMLKCFGRINMELFELGAVKCES